MESLDNTTEGLFIAPSRSKQHQNKNRCALVLPSVARYETDADTGAKRLVSSFILYPYPFRMG
jgi:hypothetical protein